MINPDSAAPGGRASPEPGGEKRAWDRVVVIFNPNSTGDAPGLAEEFRADLHERLPALPVELQPTEHAGHARTLARVAAEQGQPLIISVSGDGGYNEVVNGIMDADTPQVTAAVLAAGNANDHRRVTREHSLPEAVALAQVTRLDLLRLEIERDAGTQIRYAHSYIGVGLTPVVAVELEKGSKGSLRELGTVLRTFWKFRPFEIETADGKRQLIDSVLFANIPEMAKVLTLSQNGAPDDGRFEIVLIQHRPKWRVLATAFRAATTGLGRQPSVRLYRFTARTAMPLQIDGEVMEIEAGDRIQVQLAPAALATIT
jgi:diacylglycerol kinase family enzyme